MTDQFQVTPAIRAYLRAFDRTLRDASNESITLRETALGGVVAERPARLTVRETEVLGLRASGLQRCDIAPRLGITPRTVDNHLSAVALKLGTSDPYRLALFAAASGLISVHEERRAGSY